MDIKKQIIAYLEEACKKDQALVDTYNVDYMDKCMDYINEKAKEHIEEENRRGIVCVSVDDDVAYHWAREYFVDGFAKKYHDEEVHKRLVELSDVSKVKINHDIPEEKKERMRESLKKAREMMQQEFDF